MKQLLCAAVTTLIALPSIVHAEGCPIEFREHRYELSRADMLLDRIPSVLENCALGDRLASIQNPRILQDLKSFDFNIEDEDFFCGFGTDDIWQIATHETSAAETRNLNEYLQHLNNEMIDMVESHDIPLPWTSRTMPASDVYRHIFGSD